MCKGGLSEMKMSEAQALRNQWTAITPTWKKSIRTKGGIPAIGCTPLAKPGGDETGTKQIPPSARALIGAQRSLHMFCINCGVEIRGNFCSGCGAKAPVAPASDAPELKPAKMFWGPLLLVPLGASLHLLLCLYALVTTLSLMGADEQLSHVLRERRQAGILGDPGVLLVFEHIPNHVFGLIVFALLLILGVMGVYLMRLLQRKKGFVPFAAIAALVCAASIYFILVPAPIGPFDTLRQDVHGNWITNSDLVSAFHYNGDTPYENTFKLMAALSFFEVLGVPFLALSRRRKTMFVN